MRSMILTFLVCVTLGGGCGGAQPQTAGGHGSDAARAPAESVVRLLDAGTGDKQTLRLQLTSGDRSTMTMKMGMSMVVAVDGQRRSAVTFPPMVSLLDMEVGEVTAGTATYSYRYRSVRYDPEADAPAALVSALEAIANGLVGAHGSITVTDQGWSTINSMEVADGASAEARQMVSKMRDSLEQISAPLPKEPVGLGARWEVIQPMATEGVKVTSTSTYELVAMNASQVELKVSTVQTAERQPIEVPGNAAQLELVALDSGRGGTIVMDLKKIGLVRGDADIKTAMDVSGEAEGESFDMRMEIGLQVTFE